MTGVLARLYGDGKANARGEAADYIFASVVGAAAAVGIYLKLVDANATFDGRFAALWPLSVAAFTATIAGKTIRDVLPVESSGRHRATER